MRMTSTRSSELPAIFLKPLPSIRIQPLFSSPALMTNMHAMVSGAGLLKALNRSSEDRIGAPTKPGNNRIPNADSDRVRE